MKTLKYIFPLLLILISLSCGSTKVKETPKEKGMMQEDINKMPEAGKAPAITFAKPKVYKLDNGLRLIVVENHKLPRVTASLRMDNPPVKLRDKKGSDDLLGALLGSGSQKVSKDEFNRKIDFYGARVSINDGGFYINALSKYFPEILQLTADQALHPKFSKEEFTKEQEKLIEGLKLSEKSTPAAASRVMRKLAYGEHPYGEITQPENVKKLTLKDVLDYYKKSFIPNNAYLIVVGDVDAQKVKEMAEKHFGNWTKAPQVRGVAIPAIHNVPATEVDFVHMPNAEQTEIKVVHRSDIRKNNPDYPKVLLMNAILGGDFNSYLNMTLREKHGWTYGARSGFGTDKYGALFTAGASVRNAVADSAVVVTMEQLNKIRNEKIDQKLLYNNKQKYLGNFVLQMEKPVTIANQAYDIYVNNLPEDYYETFLQKIDAVTVDDIQQVAQKYLHPDKARIVVAGNANTTVPGLKKAGYPIKFYNKNGNPTKAPQMNQKLPADMSVKKVIDNYIKAIGGIQKVKQVKSLKTVYEGKVQGTPLKITNLGIAPNKYSSQMEAMGMVISKEVFDGKNGFRIIRGQKMDMKPEELEKMKNTPQPFDIFKLLQTGKLERIDNYDNQYFFVISEKNDNTEYYFSDKTGLLNKEVKHQKVQGREMTQTILYQNYKTVDGIKIPGKIVLGNSIQKMELNLKNIEINQLKSSDLK